MTQQELDKLQQRLITLGRTLTEEQCKEFRAILDLFAKAIYEVGETYKMAVIELIPSKLSIPTPVVTNFKPAPSLADITMSLARNLQNTLDKEKK